MLCGDGAFELLTDALANFVSSPDNKVVLRLGVFISRCIFPVPFVLATLLQKIFIHEFIPRIHFSIHVLVLSITVHVAIFTSTLFVQDHCLPCGP